MKTIRLSAGSLLIPVVLLLTGCKKEKVVARFTVETSVETGQKIAFTNASENATAYQWDFGDGGSSTEENPTHVFTHAGVYEVVLLATGDGGSDSESVSITVTKGHTIYEGTGIEGVTLLDDSWEDIQSVYTTDTLYIRSFIDNPGVYSHLVYYVNEGIAFVFYTMDDTLTGDDPVFVIFLVSPYPGRTSSGIAIGSTMDEVIEAYGYPESQQAGNGFSSYWYDSRGIDFYTYETGFVDEIDVYPASGTSSKSLSFKEFTQARMDFIRQMVPFHDHE